MAVCVFRRIHLLAFDNSDYAFIAADIIVDFRINKVIGKGWLEEDLLASRATLLKMKQARSKQMLYSIPLIIIWWGSVCFDFYSYIEEMLLFKVLVFSGSIGGVIGFVISYFLYKKMQSINDEVIQQVDRFKADENREE